MRVSRNSSNDLPRGTPIPQLMGYPISQLNFLRVIARVVVSGSRPLRLLFVVVIPLPPGDVRTFFLSIIVLLSLME